MNHDWRMKNISCFVQTGWRALDQLINPTLIGGGAGATAAASGPSGVLPSAPVRAAALHPATTPDTKPATPGGDHRLVKGFGFDIDTDAA